MYQGVVLLEIARWKPIRSIVGLDVNDALKQKQIMLKKAREMVPYVAGGSFADVIISCLLFDENSRGRNAYDAHMLLKESILSVLERLATASL